MYSDCKDDHVFIQLARMNLFTGVKPCPLSQLVGYPNHKILHIGKQRKEFIKIVTNVNDVKLTKEPLIQLVLELQNMIEGLENKDKDNCKKNIY